MLTTHSGASAPGAISRTQLPPKMIATLIRLMRSAGFAGEYESPESISLEPIHPRITCMSLDFEKGRQPRTPYGRSRSVLATLGIAPRQHREVIEIVNALTSVGCDCLSVEIRYPGSGGDWAVIRNYDIKIQPLFPGIKSMVLCVEKGVKHGPWAFTRDFV